MSLNHKMGDLAGDDALAAALTSSDPTTRIMARGAASQWVQHFSEWFNVELKATKRDNLHLLLYAVAKLQIQTFASMAGQLSDARGDDVLIDLYVDLARDELRQHLIETRQQTGRR